MKTLVALVGTQHRGADMIALLASLQNGEPLTLIRERGNKFDAFAVQVWAREQHVGFIKASQVKPIALAMDQADRTIRTARLSLKEGKTQPMVEVD